MPEYSPAVGIERTPPHNKEAEIAVLGGMILDSEALARVIQLVEPDYFYVPAHSLIYEQIRELFGKGQPVDFISVTDALRSRELLERAGGSSYIMSLVHSIPTTANIEYYGKIVERHAILRKLIRAGTKIVELGYTHEDPDVSSVLNQAEQIIFEIGQHKLGEGLEHIQSGLWHLFEELERGYNDPDAFLRKNLGTGFTDLNTMLGGGFSPSDLVILAARPAMGKTALALNIAVNMAIQHNKPVAIFNLEMSKEQLITRMLCMESGMNSRALRSGTLHTDEWQSLSNAIAKLSEAPIFLDDSSMVTPGEMRAKCRRLKAEHKELSLIIIDYLQLMDTGQGENRQQEISKISRALKQLARELHVPVVALSQLSRAVESRTNKRPMLSDLRECVVGETLVVLADGRRVPIKDLVGKTPEVLAVNDAGQVIRAQSDKVWSVGKKTVFAVRLASGRTIKATAEHRILTFNGWDKVKNLSCEVEIAVIDSVPSLEKIPAFRELRGVLSNPEKHSSDSSVALLVEPHSSVLTYQTSREILWDRIVAIEPLAEETVYDLTVPGPASWLADGIVSHNSGAIEQDADIVLFLYRDEYYNEDSNDKNTAELIIAKHRHGPTGTVRLYFEASLTRFGNLMLD